MANNNMIPMLCFKDLLIARLMYDYWKLNNTLPRQIDLFDRHTTITLKATGRVVKSGLINEFIDTHTVPPLYSLPISGNPQLQQSIRNLRLAGILHPSDPANPRARYQWQSPEAARLIDAYRPRHWRDWPIQILIDPKTLDIKKVKYA